MPNTDASGPSSVPASPEEQYRLAHAAPRFDLTVEPWIPVRYLDGTRREVGLRTVFRDAHLIADLDEGEPSQRAALRRLLTATAAHLVLLSPEGANYGAWRSRLLGNTGFPADLVDTYFDSTADYFHLYHPQSPFLQDIRYLNTPWYPAWESSIRELQPHQPGNTSRAWAFKPTDPTFAPGLDQAAAARALAARWFHALPGNGGGGDKGGAFATAGIGTTAPLTKAFRVSLASLFVSVLRNVSLATMQSDPQVVATGPAWFHAEHAEPAGDGLYLYTLSPTCTLLGPLDAEGTATSLLRGSVYGKTLPWADRIVEAKKAAKEADPHAIRRTADAKGKARSDVRIDPTASTLRQLSVLRSGMIDGENFDVLGVANPGDLWMRNLVLPDGENMELLTGVYAGSATSPMCEILRTITIDASLVDPAWAQGPDLDRLLTACFGKGGIDWTLKTQVADVFRSGTGRPGPEATGIAETATVRWLSDADAITTRALRGEFTPAEAEQALWAAAADAAAHALEPYWSSSRYASGIARAISALRRRAHRGAPTSPVPADNDSESENAA